MRKIFYLLFVFCAHVVCAQDIDFSEAVADEPLDIQAERIEYTNGTFMAEGSVTGRFEKLFFRADRATGNLDNGDLHVEGNIIFERDTSVWYGSELDYNFLKHQGVFGASSLVVDPFYLSVEQIERVSTNDYRLKDATFTTCPLDHPHFRFKVAEAELVDNRVLKAHGLKVYAGRVPIFYFPYIKYYLSNSFFKFRAGYGSNYGAYLRTQVRLPINDYVKSITSIDPFVMRGVGLGQGVEWYTPNSVGEISGYYIDDQRPDETYKHTSDQGREIGQDRYRFKFEQMYHFSDLNYINTKWNALSDPAIIEEFFKREYRSASQPENYASWVYSGDRFGSELYVNKLLNDFYNSTDRFEYNMDLYRQRIGESAFYFDSKNSISSLDQRASVFTPKETNYSVRMDSENTLYAPLRLDFLTVIPRAGYRATYYSKTTASGQDELRHILGAGVESSFQATKILSEQERWYGRGLRHKIEPYIDYAFNDAVLTEGHALYQFDRVDALDDEHRIRVGLRNVLQTKRNDRLTRFVDLDLYTDYQLLREPDDENFSDLYIDARIPFTEEVFLDLEGEYDWYDGYMDQFYTRFSMDKKDFIASLEHRYIKNDSSLWTPRLSLFPESKVSAELFGRYDDDRSDLEEIAVIGYYSHCCMRYGLGLHREDDEYRVMFSIALTAFPDEQISSGF